ncbi:MAG TPA: hypothetical protein VH475_15920 [Tepidisphaeraceae bacterium]|jgi:hypothetical protein
MQKKGNLAEMIRQLEEDRRRHAEAIEAIDQVLSQVSRAVGTVRYGVEEVVQGLPEIANLLLELPKKRKFDQTGEKSVLNFIGSRQNPTTSEINGHWRSQGRRGVANVVLLKLLKQGFIIRQADPQIRGSRYILSPAGQEATRAGATAEPVALSRDNIDVTLADVENADITSGTNRQNVPQSN